MTDRIIAANGLIVEGLPASVVESVTQSLAVPDDALDALIALRAARIEGWLPNGALLLRSNFGAAPQLLRLAAPGARLEPLTFHPRPVVSAQVASSAGFSFLLQRERTTQLYDFRLIDRSVRRIGDAAATHRDPLWSRDARRLAYTSTVRNGTDQDLYIAEVAAAAAAPRLLVAGGIVDGRRRAWQALAWSPDDSRLLLRQYLPDADSKTRDAGRLFVAQLASGAVTALNVGGVSLDAAPSSIGAARWAADGQRVLLLAALHDEPSRLYELDPVTGALRAVGAALPWPAEDLQLSAEGRRVALSFNAAGLNAVRVLDLISGAQAEPPGLPPGIVTAMHFDAEGARLALSIEDATQPGTAWVWDLRSNELTRWAGPAARAPSAGAPSAVAAVPAQRLQLPGWDRAGRRTRDLSAWMYRRAGDARIPVLIDLHRGAGRSYRPRFDAGLQYLAGTLGIAVLMPNLPLEDQDGMVRDIGSVLVWIAAQRNLDASRVTIIGRGAAAGVAVAALAQYGDRLRGAIHDDGTGVTLSSAMAALLHRPILMLQGFGAAAEGHANSRMADDGERLAARLRNARTAVWRVVVPSALAASTSPAAAAGMRTQALAAFLRHCNQ
jgi:dipeptidyl aminopeptidase/acylaminoacyl peptidase